jgi:hypothetical protein
MMFRAAHLAAAAFALIVGLSPANAATVNWVLSSPHNTDPGTTETFSATVGSNTYTLGAAGYSYSGAITSNSFTAIDLYNKFTTGDATETGLGLNSDPTGNHEIYTNTFVRLNVTTARSQGLGNFSFAFGSTTQGEAWDVYGSTSANTGLTLLKDGPANDQGNTYFLPDKNGALQAYNYFYFVYDGPPRTQNSTCGGCNVLLTAFGGDILTTTTQSSTPLPAALPLFATGLGSLGLLGWRRKRKAQAIA